MVILSAAFIKKWRKILGCFATSKNVKASVLARVNMEAAIIAENRNCDAFATCDGATWNRKMRSITGIWGNKPSVSVLCNLNQWKLQEACSLYQTSPTWSKCLRTCLLKGPLNIADGHASEAFSCVFRPYIFSMWEQGVFIQYCFTFFHPAFYITGSWERSHPDWLQ